METLKPHALLSSSSSEILRNRVQLWILYVDSTIKKETYYFSPYINLLIFRLVNAHVNIIIVLWKAECNLGSRQGRCQDKVQVGSHADWD